jgi:hypothetical protein
MHTTYRMIGWAALVAGLAYLALPIVISALLPAVFGTSDLTIGSPTTDPAVVLGARWLAAIEGGIFFVMAAGMGLIVIGTDELADAPRSLAARAHFLAGVAATFGWLLVAASSAATYSSVIETATPFGAEGRAVFFLAHAMDITTGVFAASMASGIWWIGCALYRPVARALGRPMAVVGGIGGAIMLAANLFGIPWGAILLIPLFIALGVVSLRRASPRRIAAPSPAASR